jgi:alkanesulfonate monooxygenase SsuD/methylene tetrahydromethanopterin reductase-like flavin-dependent oxidoreductase (luciferase family)
MAAEDEKLEIAPDRAVEVRETRTLFRLAHAAEKDLGRSSRQIAIVAADTEEEARQIASMHDAFGRDWRDPRFAVCDALDTPAAHVFGDVVFRSEPVAVDVGKRAAKLR